jgi:hypothetical protein
MFIMLFLLKWIFYYLYIIMLVFIITSRNRLKILLIDEEGNYINTTSNVVYKEVFCNV